MIFGGGVLLAMGCMLVPQHRVTEPKEVNLKAEYPLGVFETLSQLTHRRIDATGSRMLVDCETVTFSLA